MRTRILSVGSVALATLVGACGGDPAARRQVGPVAPAAAQVADRQVIQRASMEITVEELDGHAERVSELVAGLEYLGGLGYF